MRCTAGLLRSGCLAGGCCCCCCRCRSAAPCVLGCFAARPVKASVAPRLPLTALENLSLAVADTGWRGAAPAVAACAGAVATALLVLCLRLRLRVTGACAAVEPPAVAAGWTLPVLSCCCPDAAILPSLCKVSVSKRGTHERSPATKARCMNSMKFLRRASVFDTGHDVSPSCSDTDTMSG